ncbi:MAG: hypothetical protein AAFP82_05555, partial [Bacteroidota bacterium]
MKQNPSVPALKNHCEPPSGGEPANDKIRDVPFLKRNGNKIICFLRIGETGFTHYSFSCISL